METWAADEVTHTLHLQTKQIPQPGPGEVLLQVVACGVCRTDLHVLDGDLPTHRPHITPGHQIVATVVESGPNTTLLHPGDLVGVAWLRHTCGVCLWCTSGRENLCPTSLYTGWDADGGYADYTVVPEAFAYLLPADSDPESVAPLLCAGIIGYRALHRANLPPGGRLGIYGFGSSAHITAQLAMAAGSEVYAMTRGEHNRSLAGALGLAFVGAERAVPPEALDAAIVFAPAGDLVPVALTATSEGGTVVLAGIHMSEIPAIDYDTTLFGERDLRSVRSNTRQDGREFLKIAHNLALRPTVTTYPFSRTADALDDLRAGRLAGSAVIVR